MYQILPKDFLLREYYMYGFILSSAQPCETRSVLVPLYRWGHWGLDVQWLTES